MRMSLCLLCIGCLCLMACQKTTTPPTGETKQAALKKNDATAKVDISLPGDPVAGEQVFKKICVACHGADGRGNGGVTAADFVKEPQRLLKDNKVLLHSIANGITNGSRVMPPQKGVLKEQEMKDALSYIRKQFGQTKK